MSGVDDPNNFSGPQVFLGFDGDGDPIFGPGESPPTCFNFVDDEGFYWFRGDGDSTGLDLQIFYEGDSVNNPFFISLKVVGGGDLFGETTTIAVESIGAGNVATSTTLTAEGTGAFTIDFGVPVDHFSFTPGFLLGHSPPVMIGYKFTLIDAEGGGGGDQTIIPSDFVLFPGCPSYGFSVQPQYLVKLNTRDGGFENINRRWPRPINVYTAVPMGPADEADIQTILYFWHAMGGRATTFLIKDWTDFKSCPVQNDISAVDQPVETVTLLDSTTAYQLTKVYTVGPITQVREITQPKADTILVANEDGDPQTDFTLDASSGLLKPGATFVGTPTSWGGEFYVPVRFDSELDMQVVDKQIQSVNFTLREKRIALANTFGGSP